ncbi:MAG: cysteine--tRNA ligase, partial [Rhodospirillaceae bacterium]|nr:cysteine--tRNA ligase [Rhodospirillaceae bacterium]
MLQVYNTLSRKKQVFEPIDSNHIRIYACGPTVYDLAHIGNARSFIVFDTLVRLLRHVFPAVIYVRNITDIDDKINAAFQETGEP